MRQLQLIAHGEPSDVIELNTVSEPALGEEDVLVSMEAAPLNPSDFLLEAIRKLFRSIAARSCSILAVMKHRATARSKSV
jgi:NADPH:quinone reductase-like Zn-dependent oxidoreductase